MNLNRNKIVGTLLVLTAAFFVTGALLPTDMSSAEGLVASVDNSFTFYKLGFISGLSAVFTRLLIKENENV